MHEESSQTNHAVASKRGRMTAQWEAQLAVLALARSVHPASWTVHAQRTAQMQRICPVCLGKIAIQRFQRKGRRCGRCCCHVDRHTVYHSVIPSRTNYRSIYHLDADHAHGVGKHVKQRMSCDSQSRSLEPSTPRAGAQPHS